MTIVYGATRNIYHKLKPAIASLLDHNDADIIILAEDDTLDYPAKVINVEDQPFFYGPNTATQFRYMALMRLVLTELTNADKALWLDVDTIVCDDLTPLWNTDMTGKWWAAVEEVNGTYRPFGEHYYNSGVSMFNLKQMRADKITEKMVAAINCIRFPFPDQDVLNKHCVPEHIVPLDVRYNETFATGHTDNPCIVHYAGYPNYFEARVPRKNYLEKYL